MYEEHSPVRPTWPSSVEGRIEKSKSLASWAPGLKKVLKSAIHRIKLNALATVQKLSPAELDEVRAWETHISNGHCPYRRDCAICVEARGRDRQHKHQPTTEGFCLSLDVSGPYSAGVDQDAKKPHSKYFLTGVITIPTSGDNPLIQGLRELGMKQKDETAVGDSEPLLSSSSTAQHKEHHLVTADFGRGESPRIAAVEAGSEDPDIFREDGPESLEELSGVEVREADMMDQKWKEFLQERPTVSVASLSQSIPIPSRRPKDIISAASWITTRLKSMAVPICRVHTDRAKEFLSKDFRGWVQSLQAHQTTTSGNEPQSNSRAECEINLVKGLTRSLMHASKAPSNYWPLALRCASEIRFRRQLHGFGISTPMVLPFGVRAAARQKLWHKTDPWDNPNVPVRLWGPATDMSITSQGYYAETNDGKFIKTTAFIIPKWQAPGEPLQAIQIPPPVLQNAGPAAEAEPLQEQDLATEEEVPAEPNGEEMQLLNPQLDQEEPELITHLEVAISEGAQCQSNPEKRKVPRRLHGKQTVIPALSRLNGRAGGEEAYYECWESFANHVEQSMVFSEQSWQDLEAWMLFQHRNLGVILQDFIAEFQSEDSKETEDFELFKQVSQERRGIEAQLKSMKEQHPQLTETPEILQTKTIAMQEIRENPQEWAAPFKEEYENLCQTVIEPLTPAQVREAVSKATHVERVPGKLVATLKPPGKKKGRIVACGNFTEAASSSEVSASGVDSITIRSVLRLAAASKWQVTVCDIRRAFLNAPRIEPPGHLTLVNPPPLLTIWKIKGALYGFCESPRDWGVHRDGMKAVIGCFSRRLKSATYGRCAETLTKLWRAIFASMSMILWPLVHPQSLKAG